MAVVTCATAAVLGVSIATSQAATEASNGTLNVLTYNVAGLPSRINSATTPRGPSTIAIGERLKQYDVVNVQEDFNYHKNLYQGDSHPYRTATSGGAGFGSGLNTLSSHPFTDLDRQKWGSCQMDSGDCFTPKGFTFMRVALADGADVDFYNLHTNAGINEGDLQSRADNLRQLTQYIQAHSKGHAVVVMGDTNSRYTRVGDAIAEFSADNGLTDAWVQLKMNGRAPAKGSPDLKCPQEPTDTCEVVDKVLYRSGDNITLNAVKYSNEHAVFLDSSAAMLSDHDPVSVQLNWTRGNR
ncbi:MAG TPA: endonuclease/exonuclease/phosphatase family protein [Kineosporiaceae bacterium]